MSQPNFLFCVGATKAGTSWLHEQLDAHPECRFRTIKELHYFSMAKPAHFENALRGLGKSYETVARRVADAGDNPRPYALRRLADMKAWREVLERREIDLAAYRAFLTEGANEARLVADFTPAYSLMGPKQLAQLTDVSATSHILYLMRDPLARLWSHVRMVQGRLAAENFEQSCIDQMERILADDLSGEGEGIVQRGDYAAIISKLQMVFPAERLMVQFQEEMLAPQGMNRLWAFLGLTPAEVDVEQVVHAGRPLALTDALRARALAWLRPQYEFVAAHFPALPEAWRKNMEEGFA
jgi:hypothetical protein